MTVLHLMTFVVWCALFVVSGLAAICSAMTTRLAIAASGALLAGGIELLLMRRTVSVPVWALLGCLVVLLAVLLRMLSAVRKQLANNFLIAALLHEIASLPRTLVKAMLRRK